MPWSLEINALTSLWSKSSHNFDHFFCCFLFRHSKIPTKIIENRKKKTFNSNFKVLLNSFKALFNEKLKVPDGLFLKLFFPHFLDHCQISRKGTTNKFSTKLLKSKIKKLWKFDGCGCNHSCAIIVQIDMTPHVTAPLCPKWPKMKMTKNHPRQSIICGGLRGKY